MRKAGSNNTGMQERVADANGVVVLTGGAGGSHGGSDVSYYFGEIGIAMDIFQTYLFNGERLDNLNSQEPYLKEAVQIVQGAATSSDSTEPIAAYSTVDKDYQSSVNNTTIKKELLNKIGVNKLIIPRYKISKDNNEYHFEALSFPNNRRQITDEQKENGQFCHDNDLQLSDTEQLDAPY